MTVKKITRIAALSAIAAILQHIVVFKVSFLDVEISDLPAIIASLAMGPIAGVFVELIKNILHLPFTSTWYVGELANFIVNGVFVLVIGYIYRYNKTKKGAVISLIAGTILMTLAAILTNRFIMLPMFIKDASASVYWNMVLSLITPFNFLRGAVLSLITFFSYKKLRVLLKEKTKL